MLSPDLHNPSEPGSLIDIKVTGPTGVAYQTLNRMSSWLNLAATYTKYFRDMDRLYHDVKEQFARLEKKNQLLAGQTGAGRLSLRLGGGGGGLEEWKVHGSKVVNHGSILPDTERTDIFDDQSDRGSSVGLDDQTLTNPVRTPRSIVSGSFTAINSGSYRSAAQADTQVQPDVPLPPEGTRPADTVNRRNSGGYPASFTDTHETQSPTQPEGEYISGSPSSRMDLDDRGAETAYTNSERDFYHFYSAWEHGPWHRAAPGGIESLANLDIATPQILLDSQDALMAPEVVTVK